MYAQQRVTRCILYFLPSSLKKTVLTIVGLAVFSAAVYGGGEFELSRGENERPPRIQESSENTSGSNQKQDPPETNPERSGGGTQDRTGSLSSEGRVPAGTLPAPVREPQLGILPFTGIGQKDGENLTLILSNLPELRAEFTVITLLFNNIYALGSTQDLHRLGLTDTDAVSVIGKQLNMDFVITGHIKKLGDRNVLIMVMIKVETFEQIAGSYREFYRVQEIPSLLPDMVKKMLEAARLDISHAPALAIIPFAAPETGGLAIQDIDVLVQLLTIEIGNTGLYRVLPRTKTIEAALGVMYTLRNKPPDIGVIRAVGQAVNTPYILTGNVVNLGEKLNLLCAQIVSLENGSLHIGGDVEYRTISDGLEVIPELAFRLTGVSQGMPRISIPENMVWVAGGIFFMGGGAGNEDALPVHAVQVSSFFMGKAPVTQKEYKDLLGRNPSVFKGDNLPVENVTWYEAVEYCNKLSLREGLIPAYSGVNERIICNITANGYRLPTEAEWEYAARGGNRDALSFDYAGGNNPDIFGWYNQNSNNQTHEVRGKAPNSLGIYDMTGNVWEWCWDRYGPYRSEDLRDPLGPASGEKRVNRGGSWNSAGSQLRTICRNSGEPVSCSGGLGFRVVRSNF